METTDLTVTLPVSLMRRVCRHAEETGESLSLLFERLAVALLPPDEQDEWRQEGLRELVADYEAEFGAFTEEELKAAERVWSGSR